MANQFSAGECFHSRTVPWEFFWWCRYLEVLKYFILVILFYGSIRKMMKHCLFYTKKGFASVELSILIALKENILDFFVLCKGLILGSTSQQDEIWVSEFMWFVKQPFQDALLVREIQKIMEKLGAILANHRIWSTQRIFIIQSNFHIRNADCRVLSRDTGCSSVFE